MTDTHETYYAQALRLLHITYEDLRLEKYRVTGALEYLREAALLSSEDKYLEAIFNLGSRRAYEVLEDLYELGNHNGAIWYLANRKCRDFSNKEALLTGYFSDEPRCVAKAIELFKEGDEDIRQIIYRGSDRNSKCQQLILAAYNKAIFSYLRRPSLIKPVAYFLKINELSELTWKDLEMVTRAMRPSEVSKAHLEIYLKQGCRYTLLQQGITSVPYGHVDYRATLVHQLKEFRENT
jgi:hypothetical protein